MMNAANIAAKLREVRIARGLSQGDLAEKIDLSPSQISRIESGKRGLSIAQLAAWSSALGLQAEVLLWDPSLRTADPSPALRDRLAQQLDGLTPPARATAELLLTLWPGGATPPLEDVVIYPDVITPKSGAA